MFLTARIKDLLLHQAEFRGESEAASHRTHCSQGMTLGQQSFDAIGNPSCSWAEMKPHKRIGNERFCPFMSFRLRFAISLGLELDVCPLHFLRAMDWAKWLFSLRASDG